jgi:MFS family permease
VHARTKTAPSRGEGIFAALVVPNFRRYFVGQVISQTGSWMQQIALPWLVFELTRSGIDLGLVVAVQSLPVLLLAPYGGVVVDRAHKRTVLLCTQSSQAVLAALLGVLSLTHVVRIPEIVAIALASGVATAFDVPARQSFVIELVGPERVRNAVTLNSVTVNTARAVGPAIAAVVIATVGVTTCFFANAISFGTVLVALFTLDVRALSPAPPQARSRGQLRSGVAYVARNRELRTPLIMMGLIGTLAYEYPVSLALLAKNGLHGGAATYSLLTSALGSGAVIGGFWIASRGKTGLNACFLATSEFALMTLLAAFAPTTTFPVVAHFLSGFGYLAFNAIGNSTIQLAAEPGMRGRVMGLWSVAFQGSTLIGSPLVGLVGASLGARWALGMGGASAVIASIFCLTSIRASQPSVTEIAPATEASTA